MSFTLSFPRRVASTLLAGCLALSLGLAGCTEEEEQVLPEPAAEQALAAVDAAHFADDSIQGYGGLKGLIAQAYFATEAGADERRWDPVPGRWEPCLDRS